MHKIYQVYTALVCSFGSLVMGILNVWPSYTLALYQDQNTKILSEPMTDLEVSLVGSLPSLGAMVGSAIAGPLMNKVGRRKGGLIIALPYAVSWAIINYTTSSTVILVARFISGISGGSFIVFSPTFISEIAEDSIRGGLAAGPVTFYSGGTLVSYLLGWFVSYENIIRINIVLSVAAALLVMTAKESPFFLMRQNKEEEARAAIAHYRGASPDSKVVLEELSRIKQQINPAVELLTVRDDSDQNPDPTEKEKLNPELMTVIPEETENISPYKLLFHSPSSRRAFLVVFTTLTLQVLMGFVLIQVYAKDLFKQAAPDLSPHLCSVLFACVLVGGCLVTVFVADIAGRRVLIISSASLVAICMFALGFLQQTNLAPAWMSAVIILIYCFTFSFGAGMIPYVLLTEVFVPEVQGLASMILIEWIWFINFAIIAVFPIISKFLGFYNVCYIFALASVVDAVVSFLMVPETKGLSNHEIQEAFLKRRRK